MLKDRIIAYTKQLDLSEQVKRAAAWSLPIEGLTDEQVLEIPMVFPDYEVGRGYKAGDIFEFGGKLYRVAQDHTSQAQWVPGEAGAESLYTSIIVDPETGYDVWRQPTGAHDAYDTGDRVLYPDEGGKAYESLIDGNTYSPDAYPAGWKEIDA